ncbi:hypothetical protein SKAU_G00069480 [Synaphobranchus kaupii]|uniref:Uncharacterized protein n=1 Tax=Synaphobranchus kaupii TaxID=118154 RepID=A0A9Q1JB48_SYNKA|nr:hypothetical protein SKAU_G00069480 [Synaphobranchus kaupii]
MQVQVIPRYVDIIIAPPTIRADSGGACCGQTVENGICQREAEELDLLLFMGIPSMRCRERLQTKPQGDESEKESSPSSRAAP